ncbi:MAG: hypothetical protein JO249_06600 [Acidobacteria bacterium]|nr:hypothetical protein [Acidobacteriota bacterium]
MLRTPLWPLLVAAFVSLPVHGQRTLSAPHHGTGASVGRGFLRPSTPIISPLRPGLLPSFPPRGSFSYFHSHHRRVGVFFPYVDPYYDAFAYEETYPAAPSEPVQQQIVELPASPEPAPKAQVIEFPSAAGPATGKELPPAVFILTSGERLESRQFVLTATNLSITVNRRQQVIPLARVDVEASISANRERGVDLRVPADRNEVTLSF